MAGTYDDPNRESVGLAPIWTGAGDPPDPPPEGEADAPPKDEAAPKGKASKS